MADISMCEGGDCPKKERCYRFKATPNPYRQSYMEYAGQDGKTECPDFWEVRSKSEMKRLDCQLGDVP